jgi:hemolysin III
VKTLTLSDRFSWQKLPSLKIVNPHERFNVYSHLISGIFATIGSIFLLYETFANQSNNFIVVSIYGLSIVSVFFASTIWHTHKECENHSGKWSKIDAIAIFVAIAGAYTPVAHLYLTGFIKTLSISIQWIIAGLGSISRLKFANVKRWKTTGVYILMGWTTLLPIKQLINSMPVQYLIILIFGGIIISIGSYLFVTMKLRYFHEIFHILVSVGIGLHYFVILSSYRGNI